ncbi:O-acetylhomoserine (thiol)-lyase [Natranaerovirga hydrolytica]|uniref:homocysteine desulfhydrase n=1 Tax=Natranaerovirga hydrolytica TaxID=680378 RepID=A0A4V2Q065_9FIRM|nr:aminotransferase class V-fold PLP-dependent enzyme [Natranaerovirga hydrolytica]TCK92481.1 O-acetylhomoserine (thiol)-lyase [Natranaerovirga hydrolytica]
MRFQTNLIHGNRADDKSTGATNVPIYLSNAYARQTAKELADIFSGRNIGHVYTRISNPSVEAFEKRMLAIEGGLSATATASGMSAIYLALMNIVQPGDEIIAASGVFGGTYNLLKNLDHQGINVKFLDVLNQETLDQAITSETKIVFAETIGNPKLDILDLESVGKVCQQKEVILIVDSTVTTPYLIKPIEYGADIVIHSTSKYINGTANAIGGMIIDGGSKKYQNEKYTNFETYHKRFRQFAFTAKLKMELGKDLGATMSPTNATLNLTGVETLQLRMKEHCKNAKKLAEYLSTHSKVDEVHFPGLTSSPYYEMAQKYYGEACGGILTVRFGSKEKAFAFIDHLNIISNLANIGDTKSLVIHPASTICAQNSTKEKEQMGVYEDLVRISVGIEDIEDIIEDVNQSLENI